MNIDRVISVHLIPVIRSVPSYCLTPEGEDALDASLLWEGEMTDSEPTKAVPSSVAARAAQLAGKRRAAQLGGNIQPTDDPPSPL